MRACPILPALSRPLPHGAQVSPRELCEALMAAALANGASLRLGTVHGVCTSAAAPDGAPAVTPWLTAVLVDGEEVPCTHFAVCMGPWAACAAEWFG